MKLNCILKCTFLAEPNDDDPMLVTALETASLVFEQLDIEERLRWLRALVDGLGKQCTNSTLSSPVDILVAFPSMSNDSVLMDKGFVISCPFSYNHSFIRCFKKKIHYSGALVVNWFFSKQAKLIKQNSKVSVITESPHVN